MEKARQIRSDFFIAPVPTCQRPLERIELGKKRTVFHRRRLRRKGGRPSWGAFVFDSAGMTLWDSSKSKWDGIDYAKKTDCAIGIYFFDFNYIMLHFGGFRPIYQQIREDI